MNQNFDMTLLEWLRPAEALDVDEWADRFRILSQKSSAEPGRFRTSRTPYMRQIMKDLSTTSPVEKIVFMKSAQVGATETGNSWLGYIIDHAPAPTMMVQPTTDMAKRNSKGRIDPLIDECPQLKEKIAAAGKSRDKNNTLMAKDFPGGTLVITGANSAVGLRSTPVKNLFLDECDGYPADIDSEGSPVKLAIARTRTFSKRKIFIASTPTIHRFSEIERQFEQTDRKFFFVPCLSCGHYQTLKFQNLKWPKDEPEKARIHCEQCDRGHENFEKTEMMAKGEWRATNQEHTDRKISGYHINSLYSPVGWFSWGEIAEDFLKSKKNPNLLRSFVNTVLGETWKEQSEQPSWRQLYARRAPYPVSTLQQGALFVTAGADVQADRIEVEIVAWGRNKITWSVDYRILVGDTAKGEVWQKLQNLISERFCFDGHPDIEPLPIACIAIDSGFNTQSVYDFVRRQNPSQVIAIKGSDSQTSILGHQKTADVTAKGKKTRRGVKVWHVGASILKSELYGWLRLPVPAEHEKTPAGFCHFPEYDDEFFKMLTAEEMVTKTNAKGYPVNHWQKVRARNEALDCRIYARAAATFLGIDRFTDEIWRNFENRVMVKTAAQVAEKKSPTKITRRRSSFL